MESLKALQTDIPILLLPLRVHTRFVRVKHIAQASREFLMDLPDAQALTVNGLHATQGNWVGEELKEIATLQQLSESNNPQVRQLGSRWLNQLANRQLTGTPNWLKRQEDAFELRVRIYPDDVFVHSHEEKLSTEELAAGKVFWETYWESAATITDETQQREAWVAAWKSLQDTFLPARAAWIYRTTQPANFPPDPVESFTGQPDFSQLPVSLRTSDWTEPMRTYVLPERFIVRLYQNQQVTEFATKPIVYPLALSHDPSKEVAAATQIPDEIKWITDFEAAEKIGMAVRIPISAETYRDGIDQLIVLGVRLSLDAAGGKTALEDLLYNHQYKEGGMAILPQGTPTNNFAKTRSGYSFFGPAAADLFTTVHEGISAEIPTHWSEKKDGHFLAEALGIDLAVVQHLFHANAEDIAGASAINRLLWPATLGYYLDQFFRPLFSEATLEDIRHFFTNHVSGRGRIPAVQIGPQPYGILATTDYTKLTFSAEDDRFFSALYHNALRPLDTYWNQLKDQVKHLHNLQSFADGQPDTLHKYHPELVKLLDLHASSETFFFRPIMGEYFIWNTFRASFPGREADIKIDDKTYLDKWPTAFIWGGQEGRAHYLPTDLADKLKRIFAKLAAIPSANLEKNRIFQQHHPLNFQQLAGPVIDLFPASEDRLLSNLPNQPINYLQQLFAVDGAALDQLIRTDTALQEGEPKALLYLLARQALSRTYLETAIAMTTGQDPLISRMDFELEHLSNAEHPAPGKEAVRFIKKVSGSANTNGKLYEKNKWSYLDAAKATAIETQLANVFDDSQATSLPERLQASPKPIQSLAEQKLSLRLLSTHSTASLQRLFSEHIDLCSYRLDAWLQGLVHRRLEQERAPGIYLGAYGYLENLRAGKAPAVVFKKIDQPETLVNDTGGILGSFSSSLRQAVIPVLHLSSFAQANINLDAVLANAWIYLGTDFGATMQYEAGVPGKVIAGPIVAADSQGFMHTPSQVHAVTAAILRSGFMASNPTKLHDAFAINLGATRVHQALYLIEGVKNGQALPELLGYQFERFLHDNNEVPLDGYILDIRKRFPFKTDPDLPIDPNKPIQAQQAYGVVDGWALTEFYRSLPSNQVKQRLAQAFNIATPHVDLFVRALDQLNQQMDAVSDLLLAESVYQVAQGNLGRAATTLKMFNNEAELDVPDLIKPPGQPKLLTHLVGVCFAAATANIWPGDASDRATICPQINHWLTTQLPPPERIHVLLSAAGQSRKLSINTLQLQPIDLVYLLQEQDALQANSAFSERVRSLGVGLFPGTEAPALRIHYRDKTGFTDDEFSLFELQPLLALLHQLLSESRPMLPADLQRGTQTDLQAEHPMPTLDNTRLLEAFQAIGFGEQVAPISAIADKHAQWEALAKLGQQLFGDALPIVPEFRLANAEEFKAAFQFPDLLAAAEDPLFAVEEWMQGLAQVRSPLRIAQQVEQWQHTFALTEREHPWKIMQLPVDAQRDNYRWLGIAYPEHIQVAGDVLSLALSLPQAFDSNQPISGLVLDYWREVLPEKEVTTGIALHYDQPNVEPPQVMLLCVSPTVEGNWDWEELCGIVMDTMDRAKKRGVDPDLIAQGLDRDGTGGGPFQYLLPGVVAPICENGETPWVSFRENGVKL